MRPYAFDRVEETTETAGLDNLTLTGSTLGNRTFALAFAALGLNTGPVKYCIDDGAGAWEVGEGTFTAPATLTRTTIEASSAGGAKVDLGAGTKKVMLVFPASMANKSPQLDSRGTLAPYFGDLLNNTWIRKTSYPGFTAQDSAFSGTLYVAIEYNTSRVITSPDGVNWTLRAMPVSTAWYAIAWGNGMFVAISYNTSICATSPDGINWTQRALPAAGYWFTMTYTNGLFIAICTSSSIYATSPDGINWTQRALPSSQLWRSIAWSGTLFVVPAYNAAICATSPDGINWTQRALPQNQSWCKVAWVKNQFICLIYGSTTYLTSPDGINWTVRTFPQSIYGAAVVEGGGTVFCFNKGSSVILTSTDLLNWTVRYLPVSGQWLSGYWMGSYCMSLGDAGIMITTFDPPAVP